MPVDSISMRALIGMVQALETPGNCSALSISAIRLSTVTPGRQASFGFRLTTVSNISVGAESACRPCRDGEHEERGQDHQRLGAQHALDDGTIDPDQEAVDDVPALRH